MRKYDHVSRTAMNCPAFVLPTARGPPRNTDISIHIL